MTGLGRGRTGGPRQGHCGWSSTVCLFLTGLPILPLLTGMLSESQGRALRASAPNPQAESVAGFTRYVSQSAGSWELASAAGNKVSVRSLLKVEGRMKYGDFIWNDEGVPAGKMWVRVDLKRQTLSVFRDGHEIGTSVILYGVEDRSTPAGDFKILEKDRNHWSRAYSAPMPYSSCSRMMALPFTAATFEAALERMVASACRSVLLAGFLRQRRSETWFRS